MSYKAIYRRFRPKSFEELIGQDNISKILINQIDGGNIAHGYLFSGIRGTGKTSTAKIFARAVNCTNPKNGNPCNECENCKLSLDDNHMDIIEIDAASNNKVEDIRELKENSNYPPSKGKYKVYIVDEAHMLSKGAFNAFLKTLEEPPSYVIFILATTEEQKIPATILSRCQKYEFRPIETENISKNIQCICKEIGIEIENEALDLISINSEGAMRDALSILDKAVTSTDGNIKYEDMIDILGSMNNSELRVFVDNVLNKERLRTVECLEELLSSGKNIEVIIKDIIKYFRNIMILKVGGNVNVSKEDNDYLKNQGNLVAIERILDILDNLMKVEEHMKFSSQPKIIFEVGIISLLEYDNRVKLIKRIEILENMLAGKQIQVKKAEDKIVFKQENSEGKKSIVEEVKKEEPVEVEEKITEKVEKTPLKSIDNNAIMNRWNDGLEFIKKHKIALHALLIEGKLSSVKNGVITILFEEGFTFHKDAINKKENKEILESLLSNFYDTNIMLKFLMDYEDNNNTKKTKTPDEDNVLKQVKDIFGEENIEIK